jgi:Predicted membrane protein (DUF2232)
LRKTHPALRVAALALWTIVLSAFTAVLSGGPLKVMRNVTGPVYFWPVALALSAAAWFLGLSALALIIAAQTVLIGSFCEFDEHDFSLRQSAVLSLLLTTLIAGSSFYLWVAMHSKTWFATLNEWINQFLTQAKTLNIQAVSEIKPETIIGQIPSAVLIFLTMSLAFALVLEKSVAKWSGITIRRRERLSDFSLFEPMIWVFIAAVLGTFAQYENKVVELISLNVFNFCVAAYFFQGLAVLAKYFEVFKIGPIWRALWVVLLVFQLPMVLSLVGVIDLWANFRKFFVRKATDVRKKRVEE